MPFLQARMNLDRSLPWTPLESAVAEHASEASERAPFGTAPAWVVVTFGWPAILVVVVVVAIGPLAMGVLDMGAWAEAELAIRAVAAAASMNIRIGVAPS